MYEYKYYDTKNEKSISSSEIKSAIALENWIPTNNQVVFAKHANGFLVFINPSNIGNFDEYSASDPYDVEGSLDTDFQQRRLRCTLNLISSIIDDCERVLDVGCGQGHITHQLNTAFPDLEISGIDYSLTAIEYANRHFQDIDFAVGDAYHLPYTSDYFDAVVCNNLWEHVPDPIRMLNAIKRVTRPGGYLIISTPSRYRITNLLRVIVGKPVIFQSSKHITEYSVGQVSEQLTSGGYQLNDIISSPIKYDMNTFKQRIIFMIIYPLVKWWLQRMNSHHSLESTVFFLARKT